MGKAKGKAERVVEVEFGQPPLSRYPWSEIAEALRQRPGEWAVVLRDVRASAQWTANSGKATSVAPSLGFETRSEGNHRGEDGKQWIRKLWMRYQPEQDQSRTGKNGEKR